MARDLHMNYVRIGSLGPDAPANLRYGKSRPVDSTAAGRGAYALRAANNGVAAVSRRFERCSHVSFGRPDCLAGLRGLELRNDDPKYRFEMSRGFPAIEPNLGTRDYSRASCKNLTCIRRLG